MNDTPSQGIVATALRALAGNKWIQILAFIFVAFEVYNTAILPAIRGTIETQRAQSEAIKADIEAKKAQAEGRALFVSPVMNLSDDQRRKLICGNAELKVSLGEKYRCDIYPN